MFHSDGSDRHLAIHIQKKLVVITSIDVLIFVMFLHFFETIPILKIFSYIFYIRAHLLYFYNIIDFIFICFVHHY